MTSTDGAVEAWSRTLSIQVHINSWKKSLFGIVGGANGADRAGLELENMRLGDVEPGTEFLDLPQQTGGIVERRGWN